MGSGTLSFVPPIHRSSENDERINPDHELPHVLGRRVVDHLHDVTPELRAVVVKRNVPARPNVRGPPSDVGPQPIYEMIAVDKQQLNDRVLASSLRPVLPYCVAVAQYLGWQLKPGLSERLALVLQPTQRP